MLVDSATGHLMKLILSPWPQQTQFIDSIHRESQKTCHFISDHLILIIVGYCSATLHGPLYANKMLYEGTDYPATRCVLWCLKCVKSVFRRGIAADPAGTAHDAHSDPGCGWDTYGVSNLKFLYHLLNWVTYIIITIYNRVIPCYISLYVSYPVQ